MQYKALYRKYRPINFNDVVGQDSIVKTLQNSVKEGRISHAFLFCGPRGSGKTSVAKLYAKTINCLNVQNGNPCGKCENCVQIANGTTSDILEIDAASNNGVDEIREIRNRVNLLPSICKYKVYIIDEVHMLSTAAFNALLKTLEEPPEHVVFILATTESHKLPSTIISRCQRFDFKKINLSDIENKIKQIAVDENINISDDAANLIARISDGGLRDAIGLIDQLSLYSLKNITKEDVCEVSGIVSKNDVVELFDSITQGNTETFIKNVNLHNENGKDLKKLTEELMLYVKDLMICYCAPKYFAESKTEEIAERSINDKIDNKMLYELIIILNDLLIKMNESSYPKLLLEINILNYIKEKNIVISTEIIEKIEKEEIVEDEVPVEILPVIKDKPKTKKKLIVNLEKIEELSIVRINNAFAEANKDILKEIKNKWITIGEFALDKELGVAAGLLLDGEAKVASEKYLVIAYPYKTAVDRINALLIEAENIIAKIANSKYKIIAVIEEDWEKEKSKYITIIKSGKQYSLIEENVEYLMEETIAETSKEKNNNNKIVEIFGDLVEMK